MKDLRGVAWGELALWHGTVTMSALLTLLACALALGQRTVVSKPVDIA